MGHDPRQDQYPPEWLALVPERLRGRYDLPGWTANGVEPWGLQPDPIAADGNLFFRGFFNLLLAVQRRISGQDTWDRPFEMTGYRDRTFTWTQSEIARFIFEQWSERPQGPHCENTKIWPYCVSGAGLGLQLHDLNVGASTHSVAQEWMRYARRHYTGTDRHGDLEWFAFFHDPLVDVTCCFPDHLTGYAGIILLHHILPQDPEFGRFLYEASVRKLGWSDVSQPVRQLLPDPRFLATALLCAREVGDATTEDRLRQVAEGAFEPRFFGEDGERFGWFFGYDEPYPRGQLSAVMMLSELGAPGSWGRIFTRVDHERFGAPTLEGVDFPDLGVAAAANRDGALWIETYAGTPSRRGSQTTWRVTGLPDPEAVSIRCDDAEFEGFQVVAQDAIEVRTTVDRHAFRIATGHHGQAHRAEHPGSAGERAARAGSNALTAGRVASAAAAPGPVAAPPAGGGCSCC